MNLVRGLVQMSEVFETGIKVRYQETDQMGVVYHANYLVWFEVGRTSLIRELGIPYTVLEQKGLLLPVLEANCTFRVPAKYDDELIVRTKIEDLSAARVRFAYEVYRPADDKVLAYGFTVHAFVDKQFKPYNLKKQAPEIFEMLQGCFVGQQV